MWNSKGLKESPTKPTKKEIIFLAKKTKGLEKETVMYHLFSVYKKLLWTALLLSTSITIKFFPFSRSSARFSLRSCLRSEKPMQKTFIFISQE